MLKQNTYTRRDKRNRNIQLVDIAEASANHLAKEQWGDTGDEERRHIPEDKVIMEELECISGELVVDEVAQEIF